MTGPTYEVKRIDGKPFRKIDLVKAWCFEDSIRARLVGGNCLDWAFEGILHASPFSAPKVFRSAVDRNCQDALAAAHPVRTLPFDASDLAISAPLRLLRGRIRARNWGVEILEGSPFQSGRASTHPILPLPGSLRADPFAIEVDGVEWILFEEQVPGDRGRLRAARRVDDDWHVEAGEILPQDCHLSWPNVFHCDGKLWLVPETGDAGEVQLWECLEFPTKWVRRATLLQGRHWHDATLLRRDDLWWIFVSSGGDQPQDHSARLDIFWSEELIGPYQPHDENPVSTSVVGARPAGAFLEHEGMLIRPGQDCRGGYGTAILLHEVQELSKTRYREQILSRIDAPLGAAGIHTLNRMPSGAWIVDVSR